MKIKVFTLCSGYDSQCLALERLARHFPQFSYELVGWSEIDKHAIRAHNALFPEASERNYGDMSKIDWAKVPDFDLLTYSTPCTDISSAGQQKGVAEDSGTRSSLLWFTRNAILAKRPKFLLMENVKALVGRKFRPYAGILTMVQPSKAVEMGRESSLFEENYLYRQEQEFTFEAICQSLERAGYSVQPFVIPACSVGAPPQARQGVDCCPRQQHSTAARDG